MRPTSAFSARIDVLPVQLLHARRHLAVVQLLGQVCVLRIGDAAEALLDRLVHALQVDLVVLQRADDVVPRAGLGHGPGLRAQVLRRLCAAGGRSLALLLAAGGCLRRLGGLSPEDRGGGLRRALWGLGTALLGLGPARGRPLLAGAPADRLLGERRDVPRGQLDPNAVARQLLGETGTEEPCAQRGQRIGQPLPNTGGRALGIRRLLDHVRQQLGVPLHARGALRDTAGGRLRRDVARRKEALCARDQVGIALLTEHGPHALVLADLVQQHPHGGTGLDAIGEEVRDPVDEEALGIAAASRERRRCAVADGCLPGIPELQEAAPLQAVDQIAVPLPQLRADLQDVAAPVATRDAQEGRIAAGTGTGSGRSALLLQLGGRLVADFRYLYGPGLREPFAPSCLSRSARASLMRCTCSRRWPGGSVMRRASTATVSFFSGRIGVDLRRVEAERDHRVGQGHILVIEPGGVQHAQIGRGAGLLGLDRLALEPRLLGSVQPLLARVGGNGATANPGERSLHLRLGHTRSVEADGAGGALQVRGDRALLLSEPVVRPGASRKRARAAVDHLVGTQGAGTLQLRSHGRASRVRGAIRTTRHRQAQPPPDLVLEVLLVERLEVVQQILGRRVRVHLRGFGRGLCFTGSTTILRQRRVLGRRPASREQAPEQVGLDLRLDVRDLGAVLLRTAHVRRQAAVDAILAHVLGFQELHGRHRSDGAAQIRHHDVGAGLHARVIRQRGHGRRRRAGLHQRPGHVRLRGGPDARRGRPVGESPRIGVDRLRELVRRAAHLGGHARAAADDAAHQGRARHALADRPIRHHVLERLVAAFLQALAEQRAHAGVDRARRRFVGAREQQPVGVLAGHRGEQGGHAGAAPLLGVRQVAAELQIPQHLAARHRATDAAGQRGRDAGRRSLAEQRHERGAQGSGAADHGQHLPGAGQHLVGQPRVLRHVGLGHQVRGLGGVLRQPRS